MRLNYQTLKRRIPQIQFYTLSLDTDASQCTNQTVNGAVYRQNKQNQSAPTAYAVQNKSIKLSKTHHNTQLNNTTDHKTDNKTVNFNHKPTRLCPDVEPDPGAAAESDPGAQHGSGQTQKPHLAAYRHIKHSEYQKISFLPLAASACRSDSALWFHPALS